jgi:hypothetical protein
MTATVRLRAGSQLNRSETITVRLDPKLNYLCELAARSQRRTKSSMVEAALFDYLSLLPIDVRMRMEDRQSIAVLAEQLWDVSEWERFRRLAIVAPHLMNYEEQKIWSVLTRNPYFWQGEWERVGTTEAIFVPTIDANRLLTYRLEKSWETIKAVAAGEKDYKDLPQAEDLIPWHDELMESRLVEEWALKDRRSGDGQAVPKAD